MKYYILFGPPGAGKGTQAGALAKRCNLLHLSTGELLRAEIAAGTPLGMQAKALIDAGNFVPDEVVEGILAEKFRTTTGVDGFLLDGFPRTLSQAEDLDALLKRSGEKVNGVLSIMIPDGTVFERIARRAQVEGRADDADKNVIANRIATYHEKTEPLIAYYRAQSKYFEVDGLGTIEEVQERLNAQLEKTSE